MTDGHDGPTRYQRSGTGLEFDRAAFFSDAVYAIAMTLLVVGIGVPHVRDANLGKALSDLDSSIVSFFIGFFVLGYYWVSHHALFAGLKAAVFLLGSIPIAFASTRAAFFAWFLMFPAEALLDRVIPDPRKR